MAVPTFFDDLGEDQPVPRSCCSILNPKSKIQYLLACAALLCLLSSCGPGHDWNDDQRAVHSAMMEWSMAVSRKDANAMWEMLSPDARDVYKRELEGVTPPGVRTTVAMSKLALKPEARTPEAERERLTLLLANLPPDPEGMTAQEYYVWRVTPDLTPEGAERTGGLFAARNVKEIEIKGDRATVALEAGDPDRYSWVRHDKVWKFDLKPSTLRALEEAREKEGK